MSFPNRPVLSVASGFAICALAACGEPRDLDVAGGACFELHQARIAVNGVTMQGESLNGVQANGVQLNGIQINGIQANGVQINQRGALTVGVGVGALELDHVRLDGGRIVAMEGGKRLPDTALIGATFESGDTTVRITAVTLDDVDERLAWYELAVDGGGPVCDEAFEQGVFVSGTFDDSGAYHPDASGETMSFACANSVMNKCVAWGYAPWATSSDAYEACTRMARADYCGDGVPWTQDGTVIDVYDVFGVQERAGSMTFEAGWSGDGATCVAAPRYDVRDGEGAAIRPACWDALPRCDSFAEAQAKGALLANDSAHTPLAACEQ